MRRTLAIGLAFLFGATAVIAQDVVSAVSGTVKKVDAGTKTVVVKTADGTEHTFHFVERTSVQGADATAAGAKDAFHGVKEGSEVVVHYTKKGTEETAEEIDHVGKDGLKVTEGTVTKIDRGGKTLVVKTADGTEETYRLTEHAAKDAGKDIAKGSEKSAKVTVYYTEAGGRKIAHFFKAL
jgi:arginine repressor